MKTRIGFQQLCAITVLLVLVSAQMAPAQQAGLPANGTHGLTAAASARNAAAKAPAAAQEEENAAATGKLGGDGIKIHGHWVLEVKNPDGKLVERREFNNSLVSGGTYLSGDQLLAAILTGDLTPGGFGVTLITGSTTGLDPTTFCIPSGKETVPSGISCYPFLDENTLLYGWGDYFDGLANDNGYEVGLTTSVNFAPTVSIVLSGNYTVGTVYSFYALQIPATMSPIVAVQTWMAGCGNATNVFGTSYSAEINQTQYPNTRFTGTNQPDLQASLAPGSCNRANSGLATANAQDAVAMGVLTSTAVPNGPLTVTSGQIITITVTLSFS